MQKVINDIVAFEDKIESAYIIGSYVTNRYESSSDLDVIVILGDHSIAKSIYPLKDKYPFIDLNVLHKSLIIDKISNSPSHYISAINQIKLKSTKICGSDFVDDLRISGKNLLINQLHFPGFAWERILRFNKKEMLRDENMSHDSFKTIDLCFRFFHKSIPYYNYRHLNTLILTLCSFKLIQMNCFDLEKGGKHWFMEDYIKHCKKDIFYSFIQEYDQFIKAMNSYIFDGKVMYFESEYFRNNLFTFLQDYFEHKKQGFNQIHLNNYEKRSE